MGTYFFQKFITAIFTLFGVASVIFFLFNVLPADPSQMMLDQNSSQEQQLKIQKKYGFDLPLSEQYFRYLNDLSPLSFHPKNKEDISHYNQEKYNGVQLFSFPSFTLVLKLPYLRTSYQKRGKKVSSIIAETLPNTVILAVSSISIACLLGIILGIITAIFKDSWIDHSLQLISTLGMSIPSFFSAILFSWFFGYVLYDYTNLNMTGSLYELDDFGENINLQLKNIILPAFVLGIRPLAIIVQLVRNGLIEILSQDFIRTARSKGLSEFRIIFKHGLKNSLNPVITAVSGWFASLLAGAVFVEYIFGWRGLGKEIVNALNTIDIPVVMGAVLTIASLFILINMIVDILYTYLNPKIKSI